ncbi:amino acid ABC transporter permease [Cupriavidus sp. CuC1]|uniref:amino acid ABC transporter permease n=1 Tax=Cupriavidus sp. CuC1 TaxID=3373131 RepID=UPI0037D4612D
MELATLKMYLFPLAEGATATIALFFPTAFFAVALGLVICFCRMSSNGLLRGAAKGYIEIIRGTPLLVQLFFIYYGMPEIGIVLPGFLAGVIGLTINLSAYLAELFRGGIQSVDAGQYEAARALGLTKLQRLRAVILPQAGRMIFPALGNYALVLVKESSLVAVISVYELMRAGEMLAGATFKSLLVYSLVGAVYFLLCSVVSGVFRWGERRLAVPGYWDGAAGHDHLSKA